MTVTWRTKIAAIASRPYFLPAGLFFASLTPYIATLPRTISFEDSAEFVTAAATLGIPHPSGYPLYVLLAHLFTRLPFGTIPWRVALFSAVCAAAAVALAFVVARRLAGILGIRLSGLVQAAMAAVFLQLAVSEIWWSQAIYAKVYALHAALLLAAVWMILRFAEETGDVRWLAGSAFFLGAACANHLFLTLITVPFFLLAAAAADRRLIRPSKQWSFCLAAFAVGLLPYLFLLVRAMMQPPYIMGEIAGLRGFIDYVFRSRYGDLSFAAWRTSGLNFVLLWQLLVYLGPLPVFLACWGACRLWRVRDRRAAAGLICCLGGILSAPLATMFRTTEWTDTAAYMVRVYGLAGYAFVAVLAAVGAAWLLRRVGRTGRRSAWLFAGILFLFIPVATFAGNWGRMAPYRAAFVEEYGRELLGRLPPDAVLVVNDFSFVQDTELFVLAYLQAVEGLRRDVAVVQDSGISCFETPELPAGYARFPLDLRRRMLLMAVLNDRRFAGRPLFATFPSEYIMTGLTAASNGLAFRLTPDGGDSGRSNAQSVPAPALPPLSVLRQQMALGLVASHILYNYAAWIAETQGNKEALEPLILAIELDTAPMSDDFRAFMAHRAAVAPAAVR